MPIADVVWLILFTAGLISLLVMFFRRDRKYRARRTSETMSETVRQELEEERVRQYQRREKFAKALEKSGGPGGVR